MLLAAGAVVGGIVMSMKQTLDEGKQAAKLAKIQQQQLIQQAESVREAGRYESREKRKEAKRAQASQIAQMAAMGGEITGSNLSILAITAREFEADALVIQRNYDVRAMELRNRGQLVRWQGRLARRNARIRAFADTAMGIGTLYMIGRMTPTGTPSGTSAATGGGAYGGTMGGGPTGGASRSMIG